MDTSKAALQPPRRAVVLAALLLLAACASAPPRVVAPAGSPYGELEPLYAVSAGRETLVISVGSNGCTRKEDFGFYVERKGEAVTLAFARKRLDDCKSFAMGRTELTFAYAELGVDARAPIFILNPVAAWTGPGR